MMVGHSPVACKGLGLVPFLLLSVFLGLVQCSTYVTDFNLVSKGMRIDLVHKDFSRSDITSSERLKRVVERSQQRLESIHTTSVRNADELGDERQSIQTRLNAGTGEFVMKLAIGTPALPFYAIMDTGSDLIWTQCKPCVNCYKQPGPIFDPSSSSSYSKVPCKSSLCGQSFSCSKAQCNYEYTYGDFSFTKGVLSYETFTFSSQSIPNISFGCSRDSDGGGFTQGSGLVGFGRGPLSLNSQLAPFVGNKFSYCLVSVQNSFSKTSPLFIGDMAILNGSNVNVNGSNVNGSNVNVNDSNIKSTPLLQVSSNPSFYYLTLKGISVGSRLLQIPAGTFDIQAGGSSGVIIDSGTTITYLQQPAYDAVVNALANISLPVTDPDPFGLGLCYRQNASSNVRFPTMVFHFDGAPYRATKQNYMLQMNADVICLAILPSSSSMAIIGNVLQQNYHMLYDLEKNVLSFRRRTCAAM